MPCYVMLCRFSAQSPPMAPHFSPNKSEVPTLRPGTVSFKLSLYLSYHFPTYKYLPLRNVITLSVLFSSLL